ncbi:hypothetical protein VN12_04075 [Pirellula sp. SH-Sr6A]|uniref:DUF4339 domain-containing protein n=1 Tax=Pirellula sp. SH-Sr6A TaxID=1632865 RepID=UPI00078BC24E|nr:DUF4339 domain-containing protein [Pirellula sp. SH-Sr6A]AMV31271.1 hypothetical protein VN12_04075 [Pirellula sp. SH-Sr6A]
MSNTPRKPLIDQRKLEAYSGSPGSIPPKQTIEDRSWMVQRVHGDTYGPYTQNELENYATQGRIDLTSMVLHPRITKNQWIAVGRIAKLRELILQSTRANAEVNASRAQETSTSKGDSFSTASSVTILISGVSNIILAIFWMVFIITIPISIALVVLAIFEFMFYSGRDDMTRAKFRSSATTLGVCGIVCGLFNTISLVCGIITLANLPKKTSRKRVVL